MSERTSAVEPYLRTSRAEARKPVFAAIKLKKPVFSSELISWETLCASVALMLLTQLTLMDELAPFGLAFWAVATKGEYRRMGLYAAVMALTAVVGGNTLYGAGLLLSALVFYLLHYRMRSRLHLPIYVAVGVALLIGALPRLWLGHFYTYDVILLVVEVVLAILATTVFIQLFSFPLSALSVDKHLEAITAWIVFSGLLLLSLIQGATFLSHTAIGITRLIVLWAAFAFGPGIAAAAGALLGFLLGMQGSEFVLVGTLSFAGFLAGLFRSFGRLATAIGFLVGTVTLSLYTAGWESVSMTFTVTAIAAVLFLLLPVFPRRLQALTPFLPHPAEDEAKKVRDLTAIRIKDYALVFRELSEAFQQAAALELEKEPMMMSLVESVVERVCKHCPSRRRCWEKDSQRTYNAMLRVLADFESSHPIGETKSAEFFQKICRKKDEFIKTVELTHELESYQLNCNKRLEEGRALVTMQLSGLSQIMTDLAQEVRAGIPDAGRRINNQYFHVEIGVAQAAKGDVEICGDYYSYLELRDGKQAFILSDGMGNGSRAQQESRSAVQLVEQLLLAGFRKDAVVRTVNTILQLRSPEENFATLDVLLVDTEQGEAEFLKIGAAPSFIRLRQRVREIKSPSVPLGILDDVDLKPITVELEDDALIVMVTDGILDVMPTQPDWFKQYLAGKKLNHPQVLADEVIHEARALSRHRDLRDDITVLVCRTKRLKHKIRDFVTR